MSANPESLFRPHPPVPRPSGRLVRWWAARAAAAGLGRLFGRTGRGFGILMYHRVTPRPVDHPPPTWNVTPARFRSQLTGLLDRGYRPWPLRRALAHAAAGRPIPAAAFVVTFDDGYENVHRHAWPVLRDLGVPATVFLATAYLDADGPFPFDDWAGAGRGPDEAWRPLTAEQCIEMQDGGLVDLGCHTHTHEVFLGRPEALAEDLVASGAVLRGRFGVQAPTFAFPFGIAGPDLTDAVRGAGVRCGLTTEPDLVRPGSDPFTWGRFRVTDGDTAGTLAGYLGGWYSLFRRLRKQDRPGVRAVGAA